MQNYKRANKVLKPTAHQIFILETASHYRS